MSGVLAERESDGIRPCRPGDVLLVVGSPDAGPRAAVIALEPSPHPTSGTAEQIQMRVSLQVWIPTSGTPKWNSGIGAHDSRVAPEYGGVDRVLGEKLSLDWGYPVSDGSAYRYKSTTYADETLLAACEAAKAEAVSATTTILEVARRHQESKARWEAAVAEQFASIQVPIGGSEAS